MHIAQRLDGHFLSLLRDDSTIYPGVRIGGLRDVIV